MVEKVIVVSVILAAGVYLAWRAYRKIKMLRSRKGGCACSCSCKKGRF